STLHTFQLGELATLALDDDRTLTLKNPLSVPPQGLVLAGSGTLALEQDLTLQGDLSLASGAGARLDVTGIQLNMGSNLNLQGGTLLTDNDTNVHLQKAVTLTTGQGHLLGKLTTEAPEFLLTLGNFTDSGGVLQKTIVKVARQIAVSIPCPQSLPVTPKDQVELLGGVIIEANGELCIDSWRLGDIELNGGTLQVDADTTIDNSSILVLDSSTLRIAEATRLTYQGSTIRLGVHTLALEGGGTLTLNEDASNPLTLDEVAGSLLFSGDRSSTVSHLRIAAGDAASSPSVQLMSSGKIETLLHDQSSRIIYDSDQTLTITQGLTVLAEHVMDLSSSKGGAVLALGDNLTVSGTLRLNTSATIDNGTLVLSGGRLEVGEDVSITSDLTNLDNSTVQIAAGMTLSHSGAELNIGPHTLTLTGGGTFANTNHLTLDDPASVLELDDVAHVSKVAIPAELESGKVEVLQDTNLQTLSHAGSSRIEIANEKTLTVSAATEIPPGKSLQLIGAGGTLSLADTLTLSGTLHFVAEGTLNNGTLALNGGLLDVDENTTITTNLNQLSDSVVNVASGKTLTYLGSALDIGSNELTLSGGGTLVNPNDFRLSDPASVLNLSGVAELESVAIPEVLTTGKLTVDNHTGIKRLSLAGSSQFDLADDIRL
ncbi:MAG: hypothetical protein QF922_06310, partial [SAR324 cluster bacterium]|nr:hypothetical protein [SAR324 cluster bacterium]